MEACASRIIKDVEVSGKPPIEGSTDATNLLGYVVFQYLRTVAAADITDSMTDYFSKLAIEEELKRKKIDASRIRFSGKYPAALPLAQAQHVLPVAEDLGVHLIVNKSPRQFVTSDNPVVLHNQYCEGIDYRGVMGWNCGGLQVFFPLSPNKLVVYYDKSVYRIGGSDVGRRHSTTKSEKDVAMLNQLQILNAKHNVYFSESASERSAAQCYAYAPTRPKFREVFIETESKKLTSGDEGSLIHNYRPLLPIRFRLRSMRVKEAAKKVPLASRAELYRNPGMIPGGHSVETDLPAGTYYVDKIERY